MENVDRYPDLIPPLASELMAAPSGTGHSQPVKLDTTRTTYRALTATEEAYLTEVKMAGNDLIHLLNRRGSFREMALAKTKIEEAIMWATKGITS